MAQLLWSFYILIAGFTILVQGYTYTNNSSFLYLSRHVNVNRSKYITFFFCETKDCRHSSVIIWHFSFNSSFQYSVMLVSSSLLKLLTVWTSVILLLWIYNLRKFIPYCNAVLHKGKILLNNVGTVSYSMVKIVALEAVIHSLFREIWVSGFFITRIEVREVALMAVTRRTTHCTVLLLYCSVV